MYSQPYIPNATPQILHPQSCEQGADLFDSGAETLTALNFAICTPQMLHTKRYNPSPTLKLHTPTPTPPSLEHRADLFDFVAEGLTALNAV